MARVGAGIASTSRNERKARRQHRLPGNAVEVDHIEGLAPERRRQLRADRVRVHVRHECIAERERACQPADPNCAAPLDADRERADEAAEPGAR